MKAFLQFTLVNIHKFLFNSHYRSFLWLLFKYGSKKRYLPLRTNIAGCKFALPDAPSFVWQFKEIFVDESYHFEKVNSAPLIIDCGANVGTSCIWLRQRYPEARIIAFEADQGIAKYLEENISQNNLDNITVIKKAVWTHHDGVNFNSEGADGGSAINAIEGKHQLVPSIDLKDFLIKQDVVDFLKMDIEGAECVVIPHCGQALKKVKNIFIEYHDYKGKSQHLSQILDTLGSNNFEYWIESVHHKKSPLMTQPINGIMYLQLNIFAKQLK
ncbi:MAG: hypothetical protein RIQ89_1434 [Bacteroidota bacterium]|jgi:FkbM family methyltransferase